LRDYRDPAVEEHKRRMAAHAAAGATMEKIGRAWHEAQRPRWSPKYATKLLQALERDVFPDLGSLPLADIDGPMVLRALRKIETRGSVDTAKRVREYISAVFVFGMSEGIVPNNPAATVGKALRPIVARGKQPALTDLADLRALMRCMDDSSAGPATKLASRLLALTAVRPGVLCGAAWAEFENIDWDDPTAASPDALWRIPAERMKLELENKGEAAFAHDVPLPRQAVDAVRALRRLTGRIPLLFPSQRSTRRPMTTAALETLYKREGYQNRHVPHGWRSAFSTILNDRPSPPRREGDRHVVDLMLAHKPKGLSGSEFAYNRSQHTARRRELATEWADLISDGLRPANDLIDGRER
jgi:integrase